jgi:hypothetical protein
VIDEEAAADFGAGMDFDAGHEAHLLGEHAGGQVPTDAVKPVGDAMGQYGMEAGIAEHDFQRAFCRGIFAENGPDELAYFAYHVSSTGPTLILMGCAGVEESCELLQADRAGGRMMSGSMALTSMIPEMM